MTEEEKTTISVSKKLQQELESKGMKGDTYEDIIWKIINECEKKK
jgi:hypothetical protein